MIIFATHLVALATASGLSSGVAYWVWSRGRGRAATLFTGVLVGSAAWTGLVAIETVMPTLTAKIAVFQAVQLFSWTVPLLWFVFTLHYTGNEHLLTRPVWAVLLGNNVLVSGLAATNHVHSLVWSRYWLVADPFPHLARTRTLFYRVELLVMYAYVVIGLVLLLKLFLAARRVGKSQSAALVVAALLPLGINLGENTNVLPIAQFQYTAIGIGLVAVVAGWAMFGQRLFAVAPMARDVLLEQVDEALVVVDDQRRIADFNRAAKLLFPHLPSSLGDRIDAVVPDLIADSGSDPPFATELTTYRDGEQRTLRISASALGPSGQQGHGLVFQDVTEISDYANRLEQQTQRLEQFAATVSHDLRNPLSVAQGSVQLAREDTDHEDLDTAADALDRMNAIIEDVLLLAREGDVIDERELVTLSSVAHAAWDTAETAEATLAVECPETVAVYADRPRLRSVLENLFRNAVDHGPADVTVRLVTTDDGFAVEDDGPGLPDDRESLFEYGHTTADDGTGLGLAIVKTITAAHGWDVRAIDASSGGARFEICDVDLVQRDEVHIDAEVTTE